MFSLNNLTWTPLAKDLGDLGHVRMHLQGTDSVNIKQLCALE
jgi:hypothetical protein